LNTTKAYKIPIAHAEGRYYADENTLAKLKANGQIVFRYCNSKGEVNREANPNGSEDNIAGICNEGFNVFGMMPHPERAAASELFNEDGLAFFQALLTEVTA
jgi:phosphoribosylformylglycinamidine synthase